MRSFSEYNPVAVAAYFLAVTGIAMFCMDPVLLGLALLGALACHFLICGLRDSRIHLYTLGLFLVMTLLNPLTSHRGATVLFVMNHNPVTLESLLYGAAAAVMIVSVLYRFRSFTRIMTSDKLLYLFEAVSPKLSLVLSMTLRYVPLFSKQVKKVQSAQQAMGLYKEDNIADRFRGGLRIFSVMVTWALENGVTTADSMTARGYGTGRRSRFSLFQWKRDDTILLVSSLLLSLLTLLASGMGGAAYYPRFSLPPMTPLRLTGCAAYGLLNLLPLIIQGKEAFQWHCLTSGM